MKCIVCGRPTRGTPYGRTIIAVCDQCDERSRQESRGVTANTGGGSGVRPTITPKLTFIGKASA
jgi:hypothetical protein